MNEDIVVSELALDEAEKRVEALEDELRCASKRIVELEEQLGAKEQEVEDARKYWQDIWKATSQELDEMNEVLKSIAVFARKASR